MPLLMRRAVFRTGLASFGTLAAALLARKWWPIMLGGGGEPADPAPDPPPPLRDVSTSLVAVTRAPLPSFPVSTLSSEGGVSIGPVGALFGQHGTVLNLWATWCGPCRREMGSLSRLAGAVKRDGIAVLPVSIDRGGIDAIRGFYRENGLAALPIVADPDGVAQRVLGIGAIPVTFVLDGRGRVVARLDGGADWSTETAARAVRRTLP